MAGHLTGKPRTVLVFYVNGERVEEPDPDPRSSLLQYLRRKRHLTGTKDACGEGGCGACTVMISKYDRREDNVRHLAVNACIRPLCSLHGWAVTTIEGIGGSASTRLHPIQEQLIQHHGTQCGFCTPGFVMSMYTLLRNNPKPTEEDIHECIRGNLCRCTGYRSIFDGFRTFASYQCPMGVQCCKATASPNDACTTEEPLSKSDTAIMNPSQEPIFPPELQLTDFDKDKLDYNHCEYRWLRPVCLSELLELLTTHKSVLLVAGGTSSAWRQVNKDGTIYIDTNGIPEMYESIVGEDGVTIGAAVTLGQFEDSLRGAIKKPEENTPASLRGMLSMAQMLNQFAATQIKNVVTFGGIIASNYSDSDALPLLLARGCSFEVASARGRRTIPLTDHLLGDYEDAHATKDEVIISMTLPYIRANEYIYFAKQARRRELDAALVNSALKVSFEESSATVSDIQLFYGGIGDTTYKPQSVHLIRGKTWCIEQVKTVLEALKIETDHVFPEQSYRNGLVCSLFFKFSLAVFDDLEAHVEAGPSLYPQKWKHSMGSGVDSHYKSLQVFEDKEGEHKFDTVGKAVMHMSSKQQATGEAQYLDDMPVSRNELHVGLVLSTKPHAKLLNVDASKCLSLPGVVDFITYKDVPGSNEFAVVNIKDEQVFAKDEVTCVGQVIGAVLAKSPEQAQLATAHVEIEYEALPHILDVREAVKRSSFFSDCKRYNRGSVVDGFASSDCIVEGELETGGQEHFYMETQCSLCVPSDGNQQIDVFVSSSSPSYVQRVLTTVLGIPAHRIQCHVKRQGGHFGGKELRSWIVSTIVAVAAYKHKKPTRCVLRRDVDMQVTGGRHPALAKYKVGATQQGRIMALELEVYFNGGHTADISDQVAATSAHGLENCYFIPAVSARFVACKTNLPSNTAFRGFGTPQMMTICEHWLSHVSVALNIDQDVIREANFLKEGDEMCFNMTAANVTLHRSWDEVKGQSQYSLRKNNVHQFNSENRLKKRGISLQPMKFGFPFTAAFLNQAGALVQIYKDGTVLLTHGGVEMGQGIHTKMIQIAGRVLEMPVDAIFISDTSTAKISNTSPTGASTGSDLNGMAVLNACEILKQRLQPYREANPDGNMSAWATAAYINRVSLSATGFYAEPHSDLGFDWKSGKGKPFTYFSYSAGYSEVEIDVLTGDCTILRTDIVMDVGQSLNPAIDIGQIEGAFTMGCGLYLLEELRYDDEGKLLTCDTRTYKIPSISTVPREFNVSILKNSHNKHAVYSSKGIGEPPLLLASTVFFALKDAIQAARAEIGLTGHFRLDPPATIEKIQLACGDQLANILCSSTK